MKSIFMLAFVITFFMTGCSKNEATVNSDAENSDRVVEEVNENTLDPINEKKLDPTNEEKEEEKMVETVALYYADNELMNHYRLNRELTISSAEALVKATIEEWIKGPEVDGLHSLVPSDVIVEYVKKEDNVAYVSFSNEIYNTNLGSSGEIMMVEQLLMIFEQFGYQYVQILVEGEIPEALLGHVMTDEPIPVIDASDVQLFEKNQ